MNNINFSNQLAVKCIIDSCIKNDREAQHIIFQNFYGKMLTVCMRYSMGLAEAQDIVQESFIKIFNKINQFDNKRGSLDGWIKKIVVNTSIDYIRRKKEFTINNDYFFESIEDVSDEKDIDSYKKLKTDIILSLIQKLSPSSRTIFSMYIFDEYTHKEISNKLGISIGTSKSVLHRAKKELKKYFVEHLNK